MSPDEPDDISLPDDWFDVPTNPANEAWGEAIVAAIRAEAAENAAAAPTEPGVYRLPCGSCIGELWRAPGDDEPQWSVPGDGDGYTTESLSLTRHGPHPWIRLHSLSEAAHIIADRLAAGATIAQLIAEYDAAEQPAD